MQVLESIPIEAQLQSLIREFGNSLIVESSLFLKDEDTVSNINKIISKMEKDVLKLRKIESKISFSQD